MIALFRGIIFKIKNNIQFKKNDDEFYLNLESCEEARFELGKLYGLQNPLSGKVIDNKKLTKKEKEKLQLIEHRIKLLFRLFPSLRKLR